MNQYNRYASREEIVKYNTRSEAESMRDRQLNKTHLKKYINSELDKMDGDELRLILKVARKIKEYKIFFKMFKEL